VNNNYLYGITMLIKYLRKLLGIRTPEESFQAGVNYVNNEVAKYGAENVDEMTRLWIESDCPFDKNQFDYGMEARLKELQVPGPFEYIV